MEHSENKIEQLLERSISRFEKRLISSNNRMGYIGNWRMFTFLLGVGGSFVFYLIDLSGAGSVFLLFSVLIFAGLIYFHSEEKKYSEKIKLWISVKQNFLARLNQDWAKIPVIQNIEPPHKHPYSQDLDIVGHYSLLRLIDTTVSLEGQKNLASLLLNPNIATSEIAKRQNLIQELTRRSLLRSQLILDAGGFETNRLNTTHLLNSLKTFNIPTSATYMLWILIGLACLNLTLYLFEIVFQGPRLWIYSFIVYAITYLLYYRKISFVFGFIIHIQQGFEILEKLLHRLEKRREANAPELIQLLSPFQKIDTRPSAIIHSINKMVNRLSIRANPLVHIVINIIGPWDLYYIYRFELVRRNVVETAPQWTKAINQLEAFCSLAQFSALHPGYAFPDLNNIEHATPKLIVHKLGHPLIHRNKRVTNDFSLEGAGSTVVLTGTNMSGKSAFLRTVGINVCLAQTGAPVCAEYFSATRFRLYCSIRIDDNLEEGLSFFYTEVKRLREILLALNEESGIPVLFLIDEIFKGTNNRERIIGSTYYLNALTKSSGQGIVSSHDLELTELSSQNPKITNYHFQDAVVADKLIFDYKLREGPCPTTNALRIMALEGLPTPPQ